MGRYGGARYARQSRGELRRRRMQSVSYVALAVLGVATAAVVMMALSR
ncbi:hypothetical protein [Pseudarthrobacter sp. DSP2-3-2b1]